MKYKEMLKKKDGKDSDKTSGKADQVRAVEQIDENTRDVLTVQSGKDEYSMFGYLTRGAYTTCA